MESYKESNGQPAKRCQEANEYLDLVSRGEEILQRAHAVGKDADEKLGSLLRGKETSVARAKSRITNPERKEC